MHIVIPYAAPAGTSIQQALAQVQAPSLLALLKRLDASKVRTGQPSDLTPLHERLLAESTWPGNPAADGLVPWAAAGAARRLPGSVHGARAATSAWARLTLCHWIIHADHVEMADPAQLQVTPDESRALQDAMRGYFAEDGIALHLADDGTWLAEGEVFRDLPTASLDRVRGARVDGWIARQPQAKPLRRLQNEMQMLLYTHPVNDARAARGQAAINAFWVSSTGSLPTEAAAQQTIQVRDDLRAAALRDDATAWLQAWHALDAGPVSQLLRLASKSESATTSQTTTTPIAITLCGENAARSFALQPRTFWTRLARQFTVPDLPGLLRSL